MKKILPMILAAFAIVFCCACNAVTPGPSTTRSMAAQVSVSTTAAAKESSGRAQKSDASAEETTKETPEETIEETSEETTEETPEETTEKTREETTEKTREETEEETTKRASTRKAEEDDQVDGETVYAISDVNVRDAATKNSNVVGTLSAGEAVTKLSEDGGWTKILYDGEECYVSTSFLSDERQ